MLVSVQVWGSAVPAPPAYVTCALHVALAHLGRAALGAWHRARRSNKVSNALLAISLERLGAFFRIADEERTRPIGRDASITDIRIAIPGCNLYH